MLWERENYVSSWYKQIIKVFIKRYVLRCFSHTNGQIPDLFLDSIQYFTRPIDKISQNVCIKDELLNIS